jgi:hypothetical protein
MVDQLIDGRSARMGQMGPRGADPRQRDAIAQAMFGPRGPPPGAMMGPRGPEMMGGGGVGDQFVRDFEVRGVGETEECKESLVREKGVRHSTVRTVYRREHVGGGESARWRGPRGCEGGGVRG